MHYFLPYVVQGMMLNLVDPNLQEQNYSWSNTSSCYLP
jgi:hypothetical protein